MYAYLLSSLPGFGIDGPPPLTLDELLDRCRGFVSDGELAVLGDPAAAADGGAPTAATAVARAWLDGERQLLNAVARRRAPFWGQAAGDVGRQDVTRFRVMVEDGVTRAYEAPDPLARQRALDGLRWNLLAELAGPVPWGFAALFAYAQRLRIAWQWAQRDATAGRETLGRILDAVEARSDEPTVSDHPFEEHHG